MTYFNATLTEEQCEKIIAILKENGAVPDAVEWLDLCLRAHRAWERHADELKAALAEGMALNMGLKEAQKEQQAIQAALQEARAIFPPRG